ncbi:hypothetical protein TKK_0011533 [Trichogramma kaykai]
MSGRAVNSGSDSASSGNRAANRAYEKPDVAGGMSDKAHAATSVPIRDRVAVVRPFAVNNARPGPGVSVNANANANANTNANVNVNVNANANANVNVNTKHCRRPCAQHTHVKHLWRAPHGKHSLYLYLNSNAFSFIT